MPLEGILCQEHQRNTAFQKAGFTDGGIGIQL